MGLPGKDESIWQATAHGHPAHPRLERDISVEVAIVGGGITGVTTALRLKQAGVSVALLEGATVGAGVTEGTSGHLDATTDRRMFRQIENFGDDGARAAVDAGRRAIDDIESWVNAFGIDCGFRRIPSYVYTESADEVELMHREADAATRLGLPAEFTRDIPLPFRPPAAVRVEEQGRFHALNYTRALAQHIPGDGSHVFEKTRIVDWQDGEPCRVRTKEGHTVTSQYIILATHSPIGLLVSLHTRIAPYRSYVLGVRVKDSVPDALYWDTADPYNYIRIFDDQHSADAEVAGGTTLIIGGKDHKTGQASDAAEHFLQLERYARERFDVASIEHRWSAQVFEPADGLPYIGKAPGSRRVYVATGYAGNGLTFGTAAGILLSDLIQGRDNPWAGLFSPARVKPRAAARSFIAENADVAWRWVADRLAGPDAKKLEEIYQGDGKIIDIDGRKAAVHRDQEGKLHALSPVCTHAGCIVHWNTAEKTWDCPCHGSRFKATGEAMGPPALKDLARREIAPTAHQGAKQPPDRARRPGREAGLDERRAPTPADTEHATRPVFRPESNPDPVDADRPD